MASYKSQNALAAAFMQAFGNAWTGDDSTSVAAALALNDTVDLIRVPGGTRLHELSFNHEDFDTGTTLQVKVGYRPADGGGVLAADDDAFGTGFTFLQAANGATGRTRVAVTPIDFNEDVIVFATVTAAAAGMSAGAKKVTTFASGIARGVK